MRERAPRDERCHPSQEYTLEEFLDDLTRREPAGATLSVSPAGPQWERTAAYAQETGKILLREGRNPWNGRNGSGSLDRFDVQGTEGATEAWWIPGLTRAQHETYQRLRSDQMPMPKAVRAAQALDALERAR